MSKTSHQNTTTILKLDINALQTNVPKTGHRNITIMPKTGHRKTTNVPKTGHRNTTNKHN